MAAAVRQQPAASPRAAGGFFGFFKDGVAITTHNPGLFLPLAALHAVRWTAFFLARFLAFGSLATAVDHLKAAFNDDADGALLLRKFLGGHRWSLLLPAGAVYLVAHVTLGLAIDAATATAAVAAASSSSGEGHTTTLASLLGKAKGRNLVGPMATAAFAGAVGWGLVVVSGLAIILSSYFGTGVALLAMLFQSMAFLWLFFYYDAMCTVAVVVSVAEPGMRTAAAVGRARRLMRAGRKLAQAALYSLVARTLDKALWKMHAVAMAWLPHRALLATAPFPLDGVVVYLLLGSLKVLYTAIVTAYYFDCRRTEEKAGHRH